MAGSVTASGKRCFWTRSRARNISVFSPEGGAAGLLPQAGSTSTAGSSMTSRIRWTSAGTSSSGNGRTMSVASAVAGVNVVAKAPLYDGGRDGNAQQCIQSRALGAEFLRYARIFQMRVEGSFFGRADGGQAGEVLARHLVQSHGLAPIGQLGQS